ncbi:endo alpha-1,4 polygalactosaminidase [Oricola sp.]|uniref:endo alpha-1,4 polygalactosaminidase n=1 Tax=Oricola sp. TaxID=1979950 RepID=UPI0025D77E29|nr:endo alpha-1,4 polygalactosaminidase [Oricola sp.]MCI5077071.1 endo alpha-1,4 polygalactosaminidase [Oricola sp.]
MTRRWLPFSEARRGVVSGILGLLAASVWRPGFAAGADQRLGRAEALRLLRKVRRWGCQYQNLDIGELAATPLDLIVVEHSLDDYAGRFMSPDEIAALKRKPDGSRRLVFAYLSVGEADVKRWFWPQAWRRRPPEWLGPENRNWPGAFPVQFWNPEWQELVFGLLDQLLAAGYDGALLDRVDSYVEWSPANPNAGEEMASLVAAIAERARARHPGFMLLPQNAEDLLKNARYRGAIDALNKESLLTGLQGRDRLNAESDIRWSLDRLALAERAGIKIFVTEYLENEALKEQVRTSIRELGYTPFFGVSALDRSPE